MKTHWEHIGGHQWSLIDMDTEFHDSICTVEIERNKVPVVGYVNTKLTQKELQELMNIVYEGALGY
jgi:hypothetical protein